ncbi:MAG: hypothetical protein J6K92_03945 [Oscillospiraceae bacterium]|nr:hypothetical protein [Oscillospiraceae bacterium]
MIKLNYITRLQAIEGDLPVMRLVSDRSAVINGDTLAACTAAEMKG